MRLVLNAYMSVGGNEGIFHGVRGMVEGRMSVRMPERGVLMRGCLFSIFVCLEKNPIFMVFFCFADH